MRLLHTSDWHLGHELYGNDRSEEFVAMLLQMEQLVRKFEPDVFLISGDIFDSVFPRNSVQTLFTNALVEIHKCRPDMYIIITSGNHDSASRHEIFKTPWQALNVYAMGHIDRENPAEHIVTVPGKGHVIAVPYVHEKMLPADFYNTLIGMVPDDGLPIVLSAHTTVVGANFDGHRHIEDRGEEIVGNIRAHSIADMGTGYDYLALGHIHKAQFIHGGGHHRIRYCGSPLPVGFDEAAEHSVSIVDIARRGDEPQVQVVPICNIRPLVTLPDDGSFAPWVEVLQMLRNHEPDGNEYIRLNVLVNTTLPDDRHKLIEEAVGNKSCTVCRINPRRIDSGNTSARRTRSVREFQEEDPLVIAREYADYKGVTLSDEMIWMFKEVFNRITDNK